MVQLKSNSQTISWFWDLYTRKLLELNPPYQRRSVWNQGYRDYFIDTILLEYPAPAVFLYQEIEPSGRTRYFVVDGKQRLSTIFSFASDEFPVADNAEITELRGKYFSQFDSDRKARFWSYTFTVEYLPSVSSNVINSIFDRINRNVAKLTPQELRHARFDGQFISTAEKLSEWIQSTLPDFPRIAPTSRKQMRDVEFVAQLLLLVEEGPKGYSIDDLDTAFSDRDASWDKGQEVEDRFRRTAAALADMLTIPDGAFLRSSRFRNQADFYSLFGAVDSLQTANALPSSKDAVGRLSTFLKVVEAEEGRAKSKAAQAYFDAARSASNDAGPRKARIEIVTKVLSGQALD